VARELNVAFSGTLGVLTQAVRAGILSAAEGDQVLEEMIRSGYRSPYTSLAALL
jgi:predicted nucleic acid-binding protein